VVVVGISRLLKLLTDTSLNGGKPAEPQSVS